MRGLAIFAPILVTVALTGCSEELDREADHSREIANAAADIANKADQQVNAAIAKLGPVEPVEGDNMAANESGPEPANGSTP